MSKILNWNALRYLFLTFSLGMSLICSHVEAKHPELTPRDVKAKIEEILRSHVSHKRFTAELMERTLQNFLEELDPAKCYFLEGEVRDFLAADEAFLQRALEEIGRASCRERV